MVQGLKQAGENRHEHQLGVGRYGRRKTRELKVEKAKRRPQSLPAWAVVLFQRGQGRRLTWEGTSLCVNWKTLDCPAVGH